MQEIRELDRTNANVKTVSSYSSGDNSYIAPAITVSQEYVFPDTELSVFKRSL